MKKKSVIFTVLILVALFLLSNNIYHKTNSRVNDNDESGTKEEVKKDILNKIKLMSADDLLTNLYQEDMHIDDKNYPIILEGILLGLNDDGSISDSEADALYEKTNICTNSSYISLDSVEQKIKNIYGTTLDIDYRNITEDINYIYDQDTKRFYEMCANHRIGSNFIDTYVYDFKLNKNNAYVYIAVSYGSEEAVLENGETTDKTKVTIYTDYQKNNVYKSYIYDGSNSSDNFLLDSSNYKDFSLYKYVFKKNKNNYYFEALERVA